MQTAVSEAPSSCLSHVLGGRAACSLMLTVREAVCADFCREALLEVL